MNDFWKNIYSSEFIHSPKCYESGCNGCCCKNFFAPDKFRINNSQNATLPILKTEFDFYKANGGICGLDEPKKLEFVLLNGKKFIIYMLNCTKKGLCNPHSNRPLICRLYPFLPRINPQGEIKGFYEASLMDIFETRCTLVNNDNIKEKLKTLLKPFLNNPEIIFALMVGEKLNQYLKEYMNQNFHRDDRFYHNLEFVLMSLKAWNNQKFKQEIADIYDQVFSIGGGYKNV
ncbi:hypothetical protein [Campylobacter mucosalis]|uniref:hypothetical protein n=1 Tax=Campylobacter mucosalis TaxID=202 RepID=UPI0014703C90|nr:hypothetical protein [Campylobacter mucosalis]